MRKILIYRLLLLFFIWLVIDFGIWQQKRYNNDINKYNEIIIEKDDHISQLKSNQNSYRDTLEYIVVSLYEKENYINVGGVEDKVVDLSIEQLVNTIQNNTKDFSIFLSNVENFFSKRKDFVHNIPNIFPVMYSPEVRITSGFGYRIYPFTGETFFHKGIDITGQDKTPIIATADGIITDVWIWHRVYGKMIRIKHNGGYTTLYAHMESTKVREGQKVKRGQVIGFMGDTGKSRGIHLHYEIWKDDQLVNPIDYLSSNNSIILSN